MNRVGFLLGIIVPIILIASVLLSGCSIAGKPVLVPTPSTPVPIISPTPTASNIPSPIPSQLFAVKPEPAKPSLTPVNNSLWIYPKSDSDNPVWGIKNGIAVGVQKEGRPPKMDNAFAGAFAPGLLYIMWTDSNGKTNFFDYIAFEPLSSRGLDQSEPLKIVYYPENISYVEGLKNLSQKAEDSPEYQTYINIDKNPPAGLAKSTTFEGDLMKVCFRLSKFDKNDTYVYVIITLDSKNPREIGIEAENMLPKTRPLNYIHVTATAGSFARIRNLYLKNEIVNAKTLWKDAKPNIMCFYPTKSFALENLRADSGGVITVYSGNDETGTWIGELGGSKTTPFYGGQKFYQYWRKYPNSYHNDLKFTVNGRDSYFSGFLKPCGDPITGGITYENFDMLERYFPGQTFWFGYSYSVR